MSKLREILFAIKESHGEENKEEYPFVSAGSSSLLKALAGEPKKEQPAEGQETQEGNAEEKPAEEKPEEGAGEQGGAEGGEEEKPAEE